MSRSEKRPTVLVVEDDPDIAASIADLLRIGGYGVEIALTGEAAIATAERTKIRLVLLDWRLPTDLSGSVLVRRLREVCGFRVPVVVLSADPRAPLEARDEASDYLPKPFEAADLLDLVDHYCPL